MSGDERFRVVVGGSTVMFAVGLAVFFHKYFGVALAIAALFPGAIFGFIFGLGLWLLQRFVELWFENNQRNRGPHN